MKSDKSLIRQSAWNKKVPALSFLLFVIAFSFVSCDDDESVYPPLISELVEAVTDERGIVAGIVTDKGVCYVPQEEIISEKPDTVLRCLCGYTIAEDGMVNVYGLKQVFSQRPIPVGEVKDESMEPVVLRSMWNSGGYINMDIGILTTGNGTHSLAFVVDSVSESSLDARTTVHTRLLHKRPLEDAESYTERLYISMPVKEYAELYDSIAVSVNTYDGLSVSKFSF